MQTHLKLNHQLSDTFYFGLDLTQDDFYTSNPLEPPLLFADVYPFKSVDIGISFLGTAMVDKRESDLGFALTIGHRPRDYVRFSWLSVEAKPQYILSIFGYSFLLLHSWLKPFGNGPGTREGPSRHSPCVRTLP